MTDIKTAVVFDLDGTLLDTLDDLADSVNHVISKHGFGSVTREEVRRFVGNGAKLLVERSMYSKNGELDVDIGDPALVKLCFEEFLVHYNRNLNVKTKPYPGVLEVLECLYAYNIPMAVVSNKPDAAVKSLCNSHFDKYIKVAIGEVAGQPRKPDPTVLWGTVEELGCDNVIYVGDSEVDVRTAINADAAAILVTWGFRDRQILIDNGAKILADNSHELLHELSKLLKIDFGE